MADLNLYVASKPTTTSASTAIGATSMTVAAVQDRLGNTLTMADFGTKGRGVISPGKTKEEQFTFTGISSTTISGIKWVTMKSPYTETSGFAKAHAAGERVILSTNGPEFYDTFLNKGNDETIAGIHTFSTSPVVPTGGTGTQAANHDDIAAAVTGASGTATNTTFGTVKLSVAAASGPTPIAVGDNDARVPTTGQTALLAAITASSAELNILDGYTGTTADLNEMSAIVQATDVTGAELETLTSGSTSNADTKHTHSPIAQGEALFTGGSINIPTILADAQLIYSGTNSGGARLWKFPSTVQLISGTTASNFACFRTDGVDTIAATAGEDGLFGYASAGTAAVTLGTSWTSIMKFRFGVVPATTDTFFIGFAEDADTLDATGTSPTTSRHCGYQYNGTNWRITNGSNTTQTSTNVATPATGWHELKMVRVTGTSIAFYLDGSLLGTHTTNLPTQGPLMFYLAHINTAGVTKTIELSRFVDMYVATT